MADIISLHDNRYESAKKHGFDDANQAVQFLTDYCNVCTCLETECKINNELRYAINQNKSYWNGRFNRRSLKIEYRTLDNILPEEVILCKKFRNKSP